MSTPGRFFDPRMRGFRDRADVDDVIALLDRRAHALPAESVALAEAAGRVLAVDVVADVAVPGFDRAAMDGYALRGEETFGATPYNPLELTIVGLALPGRTQERPVLAGQAVRIMTGAPLPSGADAVLPAEQAEARGESLRVTEPIAPGRHVGRRGEDVAPGQTVLSAGRQLRPQDLGILSSLGVSSISAVRRPRVEILITGDELLPAGSRPKGCCIVDSNSPMLVALIARDGGLAQHPGILPDQRAVVREALTSTNADVLLISGGSSVGQEDHAPSLVAELGELLVHGVAVRPASPAGVGVVGGRWVFLLPGNPVSCLCAYDLFAGRAIRRLGGRNPDLPYRQRCLPLASKIASAIGRVDYVRVRIVGDAAEPIAVSGASLLSTTTAADGFVLVPRDLEGYPPGERVMTYLYDLP